MATTDDDAIETVLTPASPEISENGLSPSPYNFLFTGEDALKVTSYNSLVGVVLAIQGRMWHPKHGITPFAQTHTPNTDRSSRSTLHPVGQGYLLNLTVFASTGAPVSGQTFVRVQVIRGLTGATIALGTLVQDYITSGQDVAWPGSPIRRSTDGPGYQRTIDGTQPGFGAEVNEAVPTGASWEITALQIQLVTDATAIERAMTLEFVDFGTKIWNVKTAVGQLASLTLNYYFAAGCARADTFGPVNGKGVLNPLPYPVTLRVNQGFQTNTDNLQAGDRWGHPHYVVNERLEAA